MEQFILFCVSLLANLFSAFAGGGAGLLQLPALIFLGLPFGVALATHLGEKLAGLIQEKLSGQTAYTGLKFRAIPFYNGRPWFLPLVYRFFSLRDRLS